MPKKGEVTIEDVTSKVVVPINQARDEQKEIATSLESAKKMRETNPMPPGQGSLFGEHDYAHQVRI